MALRMLWILVIPAAFSSDSYLEPKNSMSQLGASLVLKCGTSKCEKPRFTWRALRDQPLMNTSETNPSPTESQLVFHKLTLGHEAKIECSVFCDDKRVSFPSAQVKVYSFPADPVVSGYNRLRYGEKSNLTCVVRDVYPVDGLKVEWVQGETVLNTMVEYEMSADDAVETRTSVYSYIPEFGDGKKDITCRASLELESVPVNQLTRQTTVNLTVQTPPRNIKVTVSPSWPVEEGQDVTIANRLGYSTEQITFSVTASPRKTTVTASPSWQPEEGQDVTTSCRTVSSTNAPFPSMPPPPPPPPKAHTVLPAVIAPTIAVVTVAALVTHHLRKTRARGLYALGMDIPLTV